MMPGDLIGYLFFGGCLILISAILFFILKKHRRVALIMSSILAIGYISIYFAYPSIQSNKHEKSYAVMKNYLAQMYPSQQFTISPTVYEAGVQPNEFYIHDVRTPNYGVVMRVKKKNEVVQISTWSNSQNLRQEDIWQELILHYKETYELDQPIDQIQKLAQFIDGPLTIFGLKIGDKLAIAVFNYEQAGYSLNYVEEFEQKDIVHGYYENLHIIFDTSNEQEPTISVENDSGKSN